MSTLPEPEGRKLLRVEINNSQAPIEKKPEWIRTTATVGENYQDMRSLTKTHGLHTVCAEAGCPNIYECWEDREASFLIGGAICTRRCDFCDIATGRPHEYDREEPSRLAQSVKELGLRYVTITGVARDDLPDGASWLYAETCRKIHAENENTGVELLVDDFHGKESAIAQVVDAAPQVFAHNLETVPRIFKKIRPAFRYERSLGVIQQASEGGLITKSNLILGMGETDQEIEETMVDLYEHGCHILTITQYLRPNPRFHPIDRWVHPKTFIRLSKIAEEIGFAGVMAGPLVRSSYRSGMLWAKAMHALNKPIPANLEHLEDSGSTRQEAFSVASRLHTNGNDSETDRYISKENSTITTKPTATEVPFPPAAPVLPACFSTAASAMVAQANRKVAESVQSGCCKTSSSTCTSNPQDTHLTADTGNCCDTSITPLTLESAK